MQFFNSLKGYKTYGLALLGIIYAVSGYFTGNLDQQETMNAVWTALTAAAIRNGMK